MGVLMFGIVNLWSAERRCGTARWRYIATIKTNGIRIDDEQYSVRGSVMSKKKKKFFASHSKSSAAVISVGIHAVLLVIALSFVAVTVIQKDEQSFEAKPVTRPKMQLKKLQVPVNIKKKKTQKPKLRKRLVVKPKLNQSVPDIKMPEITGVKGGMGSAGTGLGGAGSLGFSMPEINIFGVKGKGEKVFIILNAGNRMMLDELGGIPAYELIKEELVQVLGGLSSTVLFNIAIYFPDEAYVLYPKMVPATDANVAKVKEWIKPLNTFYDGKAKYGPDTLGSGGMRISGSGNDLLAPPIKSCRYWARPAMLSMSQQADVVFLLTQGWGALLYTPPDASMNKDWSAAKQERYRRDSAKANRLAEEDNSARASKGLPPRVFGNRWDKMRHYVPGIEFPPKPQMVKYGVKDMYEAMNAKYAETASKDLVRSGLAKKKKKRAYSFNVIQFVPKGGSGSEGLQELAKATRGEFEQLKGLDEIKSVAMK